MKQFIVNRHTTPSTPALDEVPNEKIRVFANETAIDAALSSLDEDEIVATEDGAESSTRIGNPLGSFILIYGNAVPYGYLPMETVFDEHQYPALYELLGTNRTPDTPYDLGADWNNSVEISSSFVNNSWTATENGWIAGTFVQSSGTVNDNYMKINGKQVAHSRNLSSYASWGNVQVRINKGDVVTFTTTNFDGIGEGNFTSIKFVPFKKYAHVVIKATSGLEETQQDYVLQSLLEADNYSTDEVATGKKWIDGKMIYRRTFYSATNWASSTVIGTISNIDMIIQIRDICSDGGAYMQNYGADAAGTTQRTTVNRATGAVTVYRGLGFANSLPSTVIVEYTKAN